MKHTKTNEHHNNEILVCSERPAEPTRCTRKIRCCERRACAAGG